MRYTTLGNTGLKISGVCLGCMGFGNPHTGQHSWTVEEETSRAIIRTALEKGINFFDTAPVYQKGTSEEFLGRALKEYAKRDEVVIATKFLPLSSEEASEGVSFERHVRQMLEGSLRRLDVNYVDLYIYHMWDYATPFETVMESLHKLVKEGLVRNLGISNCFAWQLAKANDFARHEGLTPFVSVQGHYNLIFREEEREMLPCVREEGMTYTPYSPLAGGKLSRAEGETRRFREDSYLHFKYDRMAKYDAGIIERLHGLSLEKNCSMTALALAWLLARGCVPVTGATSPAQTEALSKACDMTLSRDDTDFLEELYVPHPLAGVMAQNTPQACSSAQVWQQNRI